MSDLLPSASALDRSLVCSGSVVLPKTYSSGAAAERGTAFHKFVELQVLGVPRDVAMNQVPIEYRPWLMLVDVDALLDDYAYLDHK